jgi:hypothetical protein
MLLAAVADTISTSAANGDAQTDIRLYKIAQS